jgi:phosphatidate cytidylyltransferase
MIRTRLIVGTVLTAAAAGLLVGDTDLAPVYPVLFFCLVLVGQVAAAELVRLFPTPFRPNVLLTAFGVSAVLVANWVYHLSEYPWHQPRPPESPWPPVLAAFVGVVLVGFLVEIHRFRDPGSAVPRLALFVFAVAYLGLLGSCLAQLRWLANPVLSSVVLTLTIFVPKCGDIGAFFTGTFVGRRKMTPVLSPKKTWEGFAGGMVAAALVAVGIEAATDVFRHGWVEAAAFGVVVGVAGVLGDLAESLIKRDGQTKDAAKSIPGFGGVLDVIDSVLFAAPVAYLWFSISPIRAW